MVRRETCPFCNNKIDCREDASEDGVDKSSDGRSFAGRLTKRLDDGQAVMDCRRCKMPKTSACSALGCRNMVKERLAAYEDTGLTPEEIKEDMPDVRKIEEKLAAYEDAEVNGLLVRLPCRIGSTVYRVVEKCKPRGMDCPFEGGYGTSRCHSSKDRYKFCGAYIEETRFELAMIDEIGKTVFLTREEAEASLADDKE